jgi:hypothetical protein
VTALLLTCPKLLEPNASTSNVDELMKEFRRAGDTPLV